MYVSGNAFVSQLAPGQFHDVIEIEETIPEYNVVHPESLYEAGTEALARYPNKRLVVHFIQPHMPFIATPELVFRGGEGATDGGYGGKRDPLHVHEALACGAITREEWWRGYRENFYLAFDYAMDLVDELGGRSVVTSDHGNLAGERSWPLPVRHYGHPRGVRHPDLVEVPWAVRTVGERRDWIDEGVADSKGNLGQDEIEERLTALGYRT